MLRLFRGATLVACSHSKRRSDSFLDSGYGKRSIRNYSSQVLTGDDRVLMLGIETSCDDTAVAIVSSNKKILSHNVSSQQYLHQPWGGIYPVLAARAHETNIPFVIERTLQDCNMKLEDLHGVAVTIGPGLAPCLRVGLSAAKQLVKSSKKELPLIGINHLEAHTLIPRLIGAPDLEFPFLVLLITGGHCQLILAHSIGDYQILGSTTDDSIGEAYDKVARMIGVCYQVDTNLTLDESMRKAKQVNTEYNQTTHGGAILEQVALKGSSVLPFSVPMLKKTRTNLNFSFSGLKSQVSRYVDQHPDASDSTKADVAASFQQVATEHLIRQTQKAITVSKKLCSARESELQGLVVTGGVASNQFIRSKLLHLEQACSIQVYFPPSKFCTDNGVMVAWAGLEHMREGNASTMDYDSTVHRTRWPLGELKTDFTPEDFE